MDWLHLAGPRYLRSEDDRFFAPLADLEPGDTRVFLGIVLPIDGVAGPPAPARAPRRSYLPTSAWPCTAGSAASPARDGLETMREHARVVRALRA